VSTVSGFDASKPNVARVYDYWLGGKENFAADRRLAEEITRLNPDAPGMALDNRAFITRAVTWAAGQGVTQFIDIGAGLPTVGNTHEIALAANGAARVVYVDHDPVVLAHARAMLQGVPNTTIIEQDLLEPDKILADPALTATLDLDRPVALMLIAVLHFLTEQDGPQGIVSELVSALPPGSYLAIAHLTADFNPEEAAVAQAAGQRSGVTYVPRSRAEVAAFFAGLDLVDPGVVPLLGWRPEDGASDDSRAVRSYVAIGRKPLQPLTQAASWCAAGNCAGDPP